MGVVTCSQGSQEDPLIALSCGKKASSFVKDNWIPPCIDPQSKATLMLVDNQSANMNGNEKKTCLNLDAVGSFNPKNLR